MTNPTKNDLYTALEAALRAAEEPMECAALFELPEVREHAATVNRVSDYLGNMWRRGDVVRLPAPRLENTRAKWMYVWKGRITRKPKISEIKDAVEFASAKVDALVSRPHLQVSEEGGAVVITLQHLTITITPR